MVIEIEIPENLDFPLSEEEMRERIETLLIHLYPKSEVFLSLRLVNDTNIQEINHLTRGKPKPTDVLSFPSAPSPSPILHLGEIIVSYETLFEQAKELGHSPEKEFLRLIVHGTLHLLGYDHETSQEDEIKMQKKEDECLELFSYYEP
jgi:probable rRNA maturation factor